MPDPTPPDERTRVRPDSTPSDAPTAATGAEATAAHVPGTSASRTAPVRIGRFEVRKLLGEGAFARVYLGFDSELEREVAIKVPKSDELTPEFRDAFIRENRLAAIINHANICPIFEVGSEGGVPYIVMRVVPNTLAGVLRRLAAPMPSRNAVAIARKLALGLVAAHAQKVVHRDLKPANVLYDEANREVLIADFGLARFVDQATAASNGVPKGTPAYMAPEQARGLADQIGAHSDVYALGVILYEMLTGRVPFKGSVWEVMRDHCETPPAAPSTVRPGLDPKLDALCLKALAKAPADRYRSAKDFATALADYLRTAEVAESGTAPAGEAVPPPPAAPEPLPVAKPIEAAETIRGSGPSSRDEKRPGRRRPRRRDEREHDPEDDPAPKGGALRWALIAGGGLLGLFVLIVVIGALTNSSRPYPTDPDAGKGTYRPSDFNKIGGKSPGFGDPKSAK